MTARERHDAAHARYAIFWAPAAESALASVGERWLGREAATDRSLARQAVDGFDDGALAVITAEPRRYGLHATLKPPFRLAHEFTPAMLEADVAAFAEAQAPRSISGLRLAPIGEFLALTPTTHTVAIDTLAALCVETFDRYRAPAEAEELARRRLAGLSAQQAENLHRWGYPYVMSEFRFHVTLTGPIDRATAERLMPRLEAIFSAAAASPVEIEEIALFVQPAAGATFRLTRRFTLGTSSI